MARGTELRPVGRTIEMAVVTVITVTFMYSYLHMLSHYS